MGTTKIMPEFLRMLGIPPSLNGRFPTVRSLMGAWDRELEEAGLSKSAIERINVLRQAVADYFADEYSCGLRRMDEVEDVINYAGSRIGHLKHESLLLVALTGDLGFIGDKIFTDERPSSVGADAKTVGEWASSVGAARIIMIHNHPSGGDLKPSEADIAVTEGIRRELAERGIQLSDSMVVSRGNKVYTSSCSYVTYGVDDNLCEGVSP
jgi:DNA repair protein RadC